MNTSVFKFVNYLEGARLHLKEEIISEAKRVACITFLNDSSRVNTKEEIAQSIKEKYKDSYALCDIYSFYLEIFKEILENKDNEKAFVHQYVDLCEVLSNSPLHEKEKLEVLVAFIEYNLSFLSKVFFKDTGIFILKEKLYRVTKDYSVECISDNDDQSLDFLKTEQEIQIIMGQDISYSADYSKDIPLIFGNYLKLKDFYIDKKSNYRVEDIPEIMSLLSSFRISPELCSSIEYFLKRDCLKRKIHTKDTSVSPKEKKRQNNFITDKEYRSLRKELNRYFDFYQMKPIRTLSEEEIWYVMKILTVLEMDSQTMQTFLFRINYKSNGYNEKLEKMKFYRNYVGDESIKELEDIYCEIMKNDEDYLFWTAMFDQRLEDLKYQIPDKYGYEIHKAKKLTLRVKEETCE